MDLFRRQSQNIITSPLAGGIRHLSVRANAEPDTCLCYRSHGWVERWERQLKGAYYSYSAAPGD
jgi:hypothetical protein